ncbi:MAG TPA: hypothetical protein VEG42_00815, partial [Thermoplasmata archaeon]|nr:hypothetical protein [Thermoplasmata archaeon]
APSESEESCLVPGCGAPAVRHLSLTEARKAFSSLPERGRRAPLCRDHYREWKKATKKARQLERAAW